MSKNVPVGGARSTPSRRLAKFEPQDSLEKLDFWWRAEDLRYLSYHMYRVQVVGRTGSILKFNFAGVQWDAHPRGKGHEVDLDDIDSVYPETPSSAQKAPDLHYGFLLLASGFVEGITGIARADLSKYAEVGGKWPFGARGKSEDVEDES